MKRPRLLLLCLALTAALLALAVALRPWYAQVVAEHWRAQLKTVPDQRAEILLRKVAALGEPGIPVLVEALGSQRESVARAANRLLTQRLDSWQRSSEEEDERHQAILVEALAEQVGGFGPTAQRNAATMAAGSESGRSQPRDCMLRAGVPGDRGQRGITLGRTTGHLVVAARGAGCRWRRSAAAD